MKKVLGYILSPLTLISFTLLLVIFHPIQMIARVFSEKARQKVVMVLNYFLLQTAKFVGTRMKFEGFENLPQNRPFIIVSNHQNLLDIPVAVWGFRNHGVRFVAKKELGKGIPSISYNLVHGKSALIERENPRQAILEISKLAKFIEQENASVCIYPEGTRSKTGKVRKFQHSGIATLMKYAPSALIVPMVIDGNNRLITKGMYPLNFGVKIKYTALKPIEPNGRSAEDITLEVENLIKNKLGQC